MKKINLVCVVIATLNPLSGCANNLDAIVKLRVIDDEGKPVSNVRSKVFSASMYDAPPGFTDTNGMVKILLKNISLEIGGRFSKQGYYDSLGDFWNWGSGTLVPPADTIFPVVLKRIVEPIPMQQKKVDAVFPRLNEPVGFDMEIGDWVSPDGKGQTADIFMTAEGFYNSPKDVSMTMRAEFPGELNGIQSFHVQSSEDATQLLKSVLPVPPIAPETGYKNTFECFTRTLPTERYGTWSLDMTRRWIYRVRVEVDKDGKIISANYGWLTSDFTFSSNKGTGKIAFTYYYNPDSKSRSLEPKEIADRQVRDFPKGGVEHE